LAGLICHTCQHYHRCRLKNTSR